MERNERLTKVGDIRPSQLLFSFGVGASIELPNISVLVMGLEDWDLSHSQEVREERLLAAVQAHLGEQVEKLRTPPMSQDERTQADSPYDGKNRIGVPVIPFPRWMRCPYCHYLGPLSGGLFELKSNLYHPDRTKYVHKNCRKPGSPPKALPVRFLVACENGHLDDFPWVSFTHKGGTCSAPILKLQEWGVSGAAADVEISCDTCQASRRMSDAFGKDGEANMPQCRGRRPHLRDYQEGGCTSRMKSILLGASNSWFPVTVSTFYIPNTANKLGQLVEEHWDSLKIITSQEILQTVLQVLGLQGKLQSFSQFKIEHIFKAIEFKRSLPPTETSAEALDLKAPEWAVFSGQSTPASSPDFKITQAPLPVGYESYFERVVLAERLREVRALIGFSRIESPLDPEERQEMGEERLAPLTRGTPKWVPATEVRGEGLFFQLKENLVAAWEQRGQPTEARRRFRLAFQEWRRRRGLPVDNVTGPGPRYIMLHSLAHALMRQFTLECGYTAASVRERLYSKEPWEEGGPMAGVLIYTAAPDSEGTLGGLVSLGEPKTLARLLEQALEEIRFCSSDPLCSEHEPNGNDLHRAACHACLFAPETSCEYGNKFLDRSFLINTFSGDKGSFFHSQEK